MARVSGTSNPLRSQERPSHGRGFRRFATLSIIAFSLRLLLPVVLESHFNSRDIKAVVLQKIAPPRRPKPRKIMAWFSIFARRTE